MRSKSVTPVVLVVGGFVVVLALLAVVGLGAGGTVITEHGPSVQFSEDEAVVTDRREMGGSSFLGLQFSGKDYVVSVSRIVPQACAEGLDYEDPWPTDDAECAAAIPLVGKVSGLGTASEENAFLAIEAKVSRGCYERVEFGGAWPNDSEECREYVPGGAG
jgi:hypothetical protein